MIINWIAFNHLFIIAMEELAMQDRAHHSADPIRTITPLRQVGSARRQRTALFCIIIIIDISSSSDGVECRQLQLSESFLSCHASTITSKTIVTRRRSWSCPSAAVPRYQAILSKQLMCRCTVDGDNSCKRLYYRALYEEHDAVNIDASS